MSVDFEKLLKRWERLTKPRFLIMYPFGLFIIMFGQCDDRSLRAGIWFIIAGILLRLHANGYAIKTDSLTTSGPYAFVRNPLYLGSAWIFWGIIIMLKLGYPGFVLFFIWLGVYWKTIKCEEALLTAKYGKLYLDYKSKVPSFFPAFSPYLNGIKWKFSIERLIQSKEYKISFWILIMVSFFYFREEFAEGKGFAFKHWAVIFMALILGGIDLAGELIRRNDKRNNKIG